MENPKGTVRELDPVQRFLAAACEGVLEHGILKPAQFIAVFPPSVIFEATEDVELRARLVQKATQMRIELARTSSRTSAAEHVVDALEYGYVTPEELLAIYTPEECARYLDRATLWSQFITQAKFWEAGGQPTPDTPGAQVVVRLLTEALNLGLLTSEDVVRKIGFRLFFAKVPAPLIIDAFEASMNATDGEQFDAILVKARFSPSTIQKNVPLQAIWDRALHPVAVRNGLVIAGAKSADGDGSEGPSTRRGDPVVTVGPSVPPPAGGRAPLAGLLARPAGSETPDPKGDEASDGEAEAGEETLLSVPPGALIEDEPDSTERDRPAEAVEPELPRPSARPPSQQMLDEVFRADEPLTDGGHPPPSAEAAATETADAVPAASPPPVEPAKIRTPVPSDPDIHIDVGAASPEDASAIETLETEGGGDRQSNVNAARRMGTYVPDSEFERVGGAARDDILETLGASSTPIEPKMQAYRLLKDELGLKLAGEIGGIRQLMDVALLEVDPGVLVRDPTFLENAPNWRAGNALCSAIDRTRKDLADRLREILLPIGAASTGDNQSSGSRTHAAFATPRQPARAAATPPPLPRVLPRKATPPPFPGASAQQSKREPESSPSLSLAEKPPPFPPRASATPPRPAVKKTPGKP